DSAPGEGVRCFRHPTTPSRAVGGTRIGSIYFLSFGLEELGYPDRAWTRLREMLEVSQRSSVPSILAQASVPENPRLAAVLRPCLRCPAGCERRCDQESHSIATGRSR